MLIFGAVGAYVAWKGLELWKDKISWSHGNELKRNILVELYRLENSIEEIRTPKLTSIIIDGTSDIPRDVQSYNGFAKRYHDNWKTIMKHRNVLRSYMPEARTVWNKELQDIIDKLEPLLRELNWAIHEQLESRNPNTDQVTRRDLNKESRQRSEIIFHRRENDDFRDKINNLITTVEELLRGKTS